MNRINLLKLARFLALNAENTQKKFDMNSFREINHQCGAVCCAVGWGLMAGVEDTRQDLRLYSFKESLNGEHLHRPIALTDLEMSHIDISGWSEYSLNQFIDDGPAWDWMFSSFWSAIDNTPMGAAKRIFWLLKNDGSPEDFDSYDLENGTEEADYFLSLYNSMQINEYLQEDFDKALALLEPEKSQEFPSDILDTID